MILYIHTYIEYSKSFATIKYLENKGLLKKMFQIKVGVLYINSNIVTINLKHFTAMYLL